MEGHCPGCDQLLSCEATHRFDCGHEYHKVCLPKTQQSGASSLAQLPQRKCPMCRRGCARPQRRERVLMTSMQNGLEVMKQRLADRWFLSIARDAMSICFCSWLRHLREHQEARLIAGRVTPRNSGARSSGESFGTGNPQYVMGNCQMPSYASSSTVGASRTTFGASRARLDSHANNAVGGRPKQRARSSSARRSSHRPSTVFGMLDDAASRAWQDTQNYFDPTLPPKDGAQGLARAASSLVGGIAGIVAEPVLAAQAVPSSATDQETKLAVAGGIMKGIVGAAIGVAGAVYHLGVGLHRQSVINKRAKERQERREARRFGYYHPDDYDNDDYDYAVDDSDYADSHEEQGHLDHSDDDNVEVEYDNLHSDDEW
eukprot:TRINITY_DN48286_c0_g1_i1.p1 TRINITY_DN48286_c0_g1~~TRINITY_DN48286_c0_g1_i1.p1  ORF type:complete len:373 (-),score=27.41 TRINITY_DN48286_c0_g1_i1:355-1473(-)